nr:IS1380 family transposase [Salibacterium halotolerans]
MSASGLLLIGELLQSLNLHKRLHFLSMPGLTSSAAISHRDVVYSYLGLLSQGKNDFDWMEESRGDVFFQQSLGLQGVASSPTLRQRFNQLAQHPETLPLIWEENTRFLKQRSSSLTPTVVSTDTTQKADDLSLLPLDVDHSPFDNSGTKKEGVRFTYKKIEGYNPAFAYLGEEGHLVYAQLHEGNEHVQKSMPEVLQQALTSAKEITSERLCVRMDGGNDAQENLELCDDHGADFIIKRNPRRESPEAWLAHAEQHGTASNPREGKTIYTGRISVSGVLEERPVYQVYRLVVRTIMKDGQINMFPDIEFQRFWTSLDLPAETIIHLYKQHGTCEQFHSELKSDMDVERFPSGTFATNALVLALGSLAYNLLRSIGQDVLRGNDLPVSKNVFRQRLKTVIQHMILFASRMVQHAREQRLSLFRGHPWKACFARLFHRYAPPHKKTTYPLLLQPLLSISEPIETL